MCICDTCLGKLHEWNFGKLIITNNLILQHALSDSTNQLLHLRRFLLAQGHPQGPATIYQDNMSCMALQDKGRSTSKRTRHINIRYFWTKKQCDNGEIAIVHRATELMGAANVMTKPIQGTQFQNERYQLTNCAGSNDNQIQQ